MKPFIYLISLAIVCCFISACGHAPVNFFEPNTPRYARTNSAIAPSRIPSTIKIVSFNTEEGEATQNLLKLLENNKEVTHPDIICLQEMNLTNVQWLADALQYNYVYYPAAIHPRHKHDMGSAILSPWPIHADRKIPLPFAMDDRFIKMNRAAVSALIQIHNSPILVYSLHLGVILSPKKRAEQVRTVIDSIPSDTKTCVIAGDFNTYASMHMRPILEMFDDVQFINATANVGWTYKYWYFLNYKVALDHIFIRGAQVIEAGKVPSRKISDHLAIWVKLKL